jgi:hypothetical protein
LYFYACTVTFFLRVDLREMDIFLASMHNSKQ